MWKENSRHWAVSLLLSVFCACNIQVPKDPYALIQKLPTDPDRLNPIISNSAYSSMVDGFLFEPLIDLDPETFAPRPLIAKRWEISPDRMRYTFFLRKDVRWHDGEPLTADDVIFAYEKIQDPRTDAAPSRNYFRDVLKAEKIDDHTVRFTYREPTVGALITLGLMRPLPKHLLKDAGDFNNDPFNRRPVGNGPFRFVEWKTGRRIVLERSEDYWGEPFDIRKIVFQIIPDDLSAFRLLKKGQIDLMDLSALQWTRQTAAEKFSQKMAKHKFFSRYGTWSYLGWNLTRPFFQDKRVRKALAHLVDKEAINQKILFGLNFPITGPYYPKGPNYNHDLAPIGYNVEKANALLDEAGWKDTDGDGIRDKGGTPFRFTLLFSSGLRYYEQLTPVLRKNFLDAGIEVELRRLEAVSLFRLMHEKQFDAYLAAWGRGAGDEDLYQIFHSSQVLGGSNYIGYANVQVDRLLEAGRREFDDSRRARIYQDVHRLLYEDQPYLFMFVGPTLAARDRRFANVKEYPAGFELREWRVALP